MLTNMTNSVQSSAEAQEALQSPIASPKTPASTSFYSRQEKKISRKMQSLYRASLVLGSKAATTGTSQLSRKHTWMEQRGGYPKGAHSEVSNPRL